MCCVLRGRAPGRETLFVRARPTRPTTTDRLHARGRRLLVAGMSSIKERLNNARAKLLRRKSAASTATRSIASSGSERQVPTHTQTQTPSQTNTPQRSPTTLRKSISLPRLPNLSPGDGDDDDGHGHSNPRLAQSEVLVARPGHSGSSSRDRHSATTITSTHTPAHASSHSSSPDIRAACPRLTLEEPTPIHPPTAAVALQPADTPEPLPSPTAETSHGEPAHVPPRNPARPTPPLRRQSLVNNTDAPLLKTLLAPVVVPAAIATPPASATPTATDYFGAAPATFSAAMTHRKIWVKRPNASATLVQIREDDLVDDVRDMILKKYANSLGRSFDAPDVTLRIVPRDAAKDPSRTLGPEEDMCRTLDAHFPGGQTVNEALVIDVPQRRTPKPSPRVPLYYAHHDDATHHQTEYFPPMPAVANPSPAIPGPNGVPDQRLPLDHAPRSIAIMQTGQLAPLPSPGGGAVRRLHHTLRPKYPRQNTASPTTLAGGIPSSATSSRPPNRPRHDSSASETKHSTTSNAPIPTPPVPTDAIARQISTPPAPRIASPHLVEKKRRKKQMIDAPSLPAGLLDGSVPPINVLIVEDNIINLRVLGAFMQRLKVRWQRAMNGKEAVTKWKAGGFHLVLMDIQLPVMNGLEATKEIRRLERVNSIGVFSSGSSEAPHNRLGIDGKLENELDEDDKLEDQRLFKSPVIIVALTASSLQSDRHEALAAGCNDFLTKPVNFVWLERKVKEWGCMQALIDFDGWRRWKDFADKSDSNTNTANGKMSLSYSNVATSSGGGAGGGSSKKEKEDKEQVAEKKAKRKSLGNVPVQPSLVEESETPPPEGDAP
ncbi:hypothetical protein P153DRAFT_361426 [Dothidotthia symphoricarpi CBS 119687]|uniref:Response regulatory domain-containing protein n=1 Tax=Dothidotthia symphoricarpi CBS 119687 TaxID=1392245 RepID=A0A6A5ZXK4_9PLEO|nr:uncharacterized protein P153DRAFT_361426 [Dothidotthia symphoricarpi CBS 119687]KAF2124259.1 hypothetical protein P153DRAFT_361426 [Dothidotthia symphoricarpi CBS 119687]